MTPATELVETVREIIDLFTKAIEPVVRAMRVFLETLGRALRGYRRKAGIDRKRFARSFGISVRALVRIEKYRAPA